MSRNKLRKFKENKNFPNLVQLPNRTNWSELFGNAHPIILELACGQGDYTLALAKMFPEKNYIGVDIKGARLWRGAKTALEEKLANVAFLRTQIEELESYFPCQIKTIKNHRPKADPPRADKSAIINQVTDIWITFPDPFPKKRQIKKRLTSLRFLEMYKKLLNPNGRLHLKTDDLDFFNYSVETAIANGWQIKKINNNIYAQKNLDPLLQIQTFYEKQHLKNGKQIHYLCVTP